MQNLTFKQGGFSIISEHHSRREERPREVDHRSNAERGYDKQKNRGARNPEPFTERTIASSRGETD